MTDKVLCRIEEVNYLKHKKIVSLWNVHLSKTNYLIKQKFNKTNGFEFII